MNISNRALALTCFTLMLCGCDSGGGAGLLGSNQPLADIPSNLNGELKGYIWSARNGEIFDLERGVSINLSDEGKIYPSRDGAEYIQHIREHSSVKEDDPCNSFIKYRDIDLINIRDTETGEIKTSFELKFQISGEIKLSPDGQTMVAYAFNPLDCENDHLLFPVIISRQGEVIIRGVSSLLSFDWTPDNRLIFIRSYGGGEYKLRLGSERNTLRSKSISSLEGVIGSPRKLSVSLDGKSALFEGYLGKNQFLSGVKYRNSTAYKIDIDGTKLVQIADTSRDGDKRVNQPIWSPDGSTILVTENYTSGVNVTIYGSDEITPIVTGVSAIPVSRESVTYAISVNHGTTLLPPDAYSDLVRPIFTRSKGNLVAKFFNPLEHLRWTKTIRD